MSLNLWEGVYDNLPSLILLFIIPICLRWFLGEPYGTKPKETKEGIKIFKPYYTVRLLGYFSVVILSFIYLVFCFSPAGRALSLFFVILHIFFLGWILFGLYLIFYFHTFRIEVITDKKIVIIHYPFKKTRTVNLSDIKSILRGISGDVFLKFEDKTYIRINPQLKGFPDLMEIFKENNIPIKLEKNGEAFWQQRIF